MKKIYMLIVLLATAGMQAQVLNQSANWPNAEWTLTGSYSTDPLALESDPTLTANFAFDDDDAGNGHEDNIAAESPVIDLTPAFTAGEFGIQVSVMYGYRYLAEDRLIFQYWDADAAAWTDWGSPLPGNNTSVTDVFCNIPRTLYTTPALNISGFTPTQLSGFRYRISYDDNPNGTDWNYGFCFESPTIMSIACFAPTSVLANVTGVTAEITWDGAVDAYEYVLDQSADDPDSGTTTTDTSFTAEDLEYSTVYYFHVRSVCGESVSAWTTIVVQTGVENDDCATAIALTPAGSYAAGAVESTIAGALDSAGAPAPGCAQYLGSDVWYSVVIPDSGSITIETGPAQDITTFDSGIALYSGTCEELELIECDDDDAATGNFSLISLTGRTPGEVIYIRVWEYFNDETEPFSISAWDASLGNSKFDAVNFMAHPNPVTNILNLSYSSPIKTIEVLNLLGQQIIGKAVNQTEYALDMTDLPSGTYLVKMSAEDGVRTVKVLKE